MFGGGIVLKQISLIYFYFYFFVYKYANYDQ